MCSKGQSLQWGGVSRTPLPLKSLEKPSPHPSWLLVAASGPWGLCGLWPPHSSLLPVRLCVLSSSCKNTVKVDWMPTLLQHDLL